MEVSSSHQIYVFSLSVILGMVCGAFFDVQRFLRKISSAGTVRTTLEDILFAILCVAIMLGSSFMINNGEIRYYQIMGAISGMLFYAALLSRTFLKILEFVFRITVNLFVKPLIKTVRLLMIPVRKIVSAIKRRALRIKNRLRGIRRGAKKRKKLIKKRMKML